MKARVSLIDGVSFDGTAESGHRVVMDGPPELGGQDKGTRPMEMLLLGLGGCSAFDVVHMLRKGRVEMTDCEVQVEAERAAQAPKVFTRIHLHFVISGKEIPESKVRRAVQLSAEKYCSASIMFSQVARVTHDFEIIESESVN
jgi:putative redox protein